MDSTKILQILQRDHKAQMRAKWASAGGHIFMIAAVLVALYYAGLFWYYTRPLALFLVVFAAIRIALILRYKKNAERFIELVEKEPGRVVWIYLRHYRKQIAEDVTTRALEIVICTDYGFEYVLREYKEDEFVPIMNHYFPEAEWTFKPEYVKLYRSNPRNFKNEVEKIFEAERKSKVDR